MVIEGPSKAVEHCSPGDAVEWGPYIYCSSLLLFVDAADETCLEEKPTSFAFRSPLASDELRVDLSAEARKVTENLGMVIDCC